MHDDLGLEQPDCGLHQRVVKRVTNGPDRAGNPSLSELFGECKRGVLAARIGVMQEPSRGELRIRATSRK